MDTAKLILMHIVMLVLLAGGNILFYPGVVFPSIAGEDDLSCPNLGSKILHGVLAAFLGTVFVAIFLRVFTKMETGKWTTVDPTKSNPYNFQRY